MSERENKALMRRFYTNVVNEGNLDLIDELIHENFVEHEAFPSLAPTRDGVKQFFAMMMNAFEGFHMDVEDLIAEGDKVVARITVKGIHRGDFMNIPATGKAVEFAAIDILRYADGKAIEHWGVTDGMTMMEQLGVLPE